MGTLRSLSSALLVLWIMTLLAAVFYPADTRAANACVSTGSGNWSASATWTGCGGGVPGAGDSVTIASGHTVTVDVNAAAAAVTVNNGALATTLALVGGKTLAVTGTVTVANPTANTATTTISVDGGNLSAGSITLSGANTNKVGLLTIGNGTVTISDSVTFSGTAANARVVFTGNGILNLTGNFNSGGTLATAGGFGTINFNGASAQVIGAYTTYNNVQINNSGGGVTFGGTTTIGGTLLVNAGTLDADGKTIVVTGATIINSTLRVSSTAGTKTFGDIVIENDGDFDFTAAEALTVNGDFEIDGTGAVTGASGVWTLQKTGGGTISGSAPGISIPGSATFATAYVLPSAFTVSGLTVNSGINEINTGTTTINGTLAGAGAFTQDSGTLLGVRSVTISSLDATVANNTVSYIGGVAGTLKGASYANLDVSKSSGFNANASGTVDVTGNLTVTSGTLNFAGSTFTAHGLTDVYGKITDSSGGPAGGSTVFDGLVTMHPGSDWFAIVGEVCDFHFQNGFVMNGSSFVSAGGTYYFEANDQSLSGTLPLTFTNLSVSGITLSSSVDVTATGTLGLADGRISTGAHTLTLGMNGAVTRTSGYVIGNFQKSILTTATTTFEIGDTSRYAPIDVAFDTLTATGTLTASTTAGNQPSIASSIVDAAKTAARYWTVVNSRIAFTTYGAVFTFDPADNASGNAPAFIAGRYDGAWHYPTLGSVTVASTEIVSETGFGDFQLGERLNSDKAITEFSILGNGTVSESDHTIAVSVPFGTDVTALAPTITASGSSVNPVSGVNADFSSPKTYTVTAADGSTQGYVVTVSILPAPAAGGSISFGSILWGVPFNLPVISPAAPEAAVLPLAAATAASGAADSVISLPPLSVHPTVSLSPAPQARVAALFDVVIGPAAIPLEWWWVPFAIPAIFAGAYILWWFIALRNRRRTQPQKGLIQIMP